MYTVYIIKQFENVLYVGKTVNFKRRKYEHTYRKKLNKTYSFEILESGLSKEKAKQKEEFYIKKYNTFLNGWNKTEGEGTKGVRNKKGDGRFTPGNEMFKKRKIKKVICVETGKIYNSVKECSIDVGGLETSIYKVCNGERKTYKKKHFQYV